MTREEAHNVDGMYYEDIVNAIFDDIDSRICKNCKYQTDSSLCGEGVVYDNYMDRDKFGCNKFERKLESK